MNNRSKQLRELLASSELQLAPGVFDGLSARLVAQAGFKIAYASGGAIARSMGLPDLGLISYTQIAARLAEIVNVVDIPVIADFDNGYGNALNAQHAIKAFIRAGVAGVHIEDQSLPKRCGHLSGKTLISAEEMAGKIKAVRDSVPPEFYLIARTDAIAVEGLGAALARAQQYIKAGADMLFVEAPTTIGQIETIAKELPYPKLLNMFYSGKTPVVPLQKLQNLGYQLVIVPSDLQRAGIKAMQLTLRVLKAEGHTESIRERLVTFKEREEIIDTERYLKASENYR